MRLHRLHRLHVATLNEWDGTTFNLRLHKEEKILDFYSEQGQLFCFVVCSDYIRTEGGEIYRGVDTVDTTNNRTYCIVEKRFTLPKVKKTEDLKFIKIVPPRWALFEIIDLNELGKRGVEGFNFGYNGIYQEAGEMWKAIAKGEAEKDA